MNLAYETKLGRLYFGDAKDIGTILEPDALDLVFTDPPYPKQFFPCYESLARVYPTYMKSGASLFTIVGHYALEKVINEFMGKLKFRWIFDLDQELGPHPRMSMGIEVMWKPMLWYVKDKFPKERYCGFVRDKIVIPKKEKNLHEWQQSLAWGYDIIRKVTKEDELVCDPFVGSGTVPAICEQLGRRWIAVDCDKRAIDITIERLSNVKNL